MGEKTAAQMSLKLSWCMQDGLEEAGTATLEEVPTTSACSMIQTILDNNLGCKLTATCMELSIGQWEDHFKLFFDTMSPVLCAMFQQGQQSQ